MRILCWNMAAAFNYDKKRHAEAWAWLNAQQPDVALLQEVVPHEEALVGWESVAFRGKYKRHGCAVLVRAGGYELWEPTPEEPWLQRIGGAACVAKPEDGHGMWLVSVHSDAASFEEINKRYPTWYADLPSRDGIPRCSESDMWEIEALAAELRPVLDGSLFVLGGDLNSARLFDDAGNHENERLFENLASQGYVDTRPRHAPQEVRTFYKQGRRPFQLDHVFADLDTEKRVSSWRVIPEPAEALDLSDHAPIEIQLDF